MLVVMRPNATSAEIARVVKVIQSHGLTPHPLPGATRTAIGMTGNTTAVEKGLSGVDEATRVTKPFKLTSREMKTEPTVVKTPFGDMGAGTFAVVVRRCVLPSPCW